MTFQRQFTIEVRVQGTERAYARIKRHMVATARSLHDTIPGAQVFVFSDDFFMGHKDIATITTLKAERRSKGVTAR